MSMTLDRPRPPAAPPAAVPPPVEPTFSGRRSRLSRFGLVAIIIAPPVLIALGWGVPAVLFLKQQPAPTAAAAHPPDGVAVYLQNCAGCHGERGDGRGATSLSLAIPARRFGEDKFRLATTANGVPSDADLTGLIRHGIPGTAMPAFPHLRDDEVAAAIDRVRDLTRRGIYERLRRKAEADGDADLAELSQAADRMAAPGSPVEVPPRFAAATPESLAHGRQVFVATCASCHGPEGRGDGPQVKDLKNDDGSPTRPRDLTAGVFKGGRTPERVYARIMLGMPGTPMPASGNLPPQDVKDLVDYVLSLSEPAAAVVVASGGG